MSQNGNNDDIIEKKDLENQKLGKTRYIDLEFSHKSVGGETFINFSALVTPPEYSALDGFTNPSPASLIEATIRYNKPNVEISSTGERGKLFHREDYIITSNGGIKLLYETVENEIISGVIRSIVRNQPAILDVSKVVKTGDLAEGQTTFVIGQSFGLFDNPSEQIGAVVVLRFKGEETPEMMFRNEGNLPNGIGNYYEVDGGNNLCNTIEFNEAGQVDGEHIVVYSYALQVGKPQASYQAELETMGGQLDVVTEFLTAIHGLGSNIFQTVANQIDLASFGQKVAELYGIIVGAVAFPASFLAKLKLVFGVTKFQTKYLVTTPVATGIMTEITYNNLVIGRSYAVSTKFRQVDTTTSTNEKYTVVTIRNGATILGIDYARAINLSRVQVPLNTRIVFTATAIDVTFDLAGKTNSSLSGNGTSTNSYVQLEELPNHVETNDFD